jgi:hypothetical protein
VPRALRAALEDAALPNRPDGALMVKSRELNAGLSPKAVIKFVALHSSEFHSAI